MQLFLSIKETNLMLEVENVFFSNIPILQKHIYYMMKKTKNVFFPEMSFF